MKTILWAALTANGAYMHGGTGYQWKKQIFDDFDACAIDAGNYIVGRKTYEEYSASGGGFSGLDVVVVSRTVQEIPEVTCVSTPQEAIKYLEQKGHAKALVAGGDSLINAFLAEGLGDEIVFNVTPELVGIGGQIALPDNAHNAMNLLEVTELGEGIVKLRYSIQLRDKG